MRLETTSYSSSYLCMGGWLHSNACCSAVQYRRRATSDLGLHAIYLLSYSDARGRRQQQLPKVAGSGYEVMEGLAQGMARTARERRKRERGTFLSLFFPAEMRCSSNSANTASPLFEGLLRQHNTVHGGVQVRMDPSVLRSHMPLSICLLLCQYASCSANMPLPICLS